MHILMTTDTVGGVWSYCVELARALGPRGVHVSLAAKGKLTADQVASAEALENVTLFVADYKLEWMEEPWHDVEEAGQWLLSLADDLQPDVIHLNDYAHGSLPWNAPVLMVGHSCVVSWFHDVRGQEPDSRWDRYQDEVRRGLLGADMVIAPTQHMLNSLNRHYGPLGRRAVVPNGCDASRFRAAEKEPFIFAAGRLWDEAKNVQKVAEAAPHLSWHVRVASVPSPDGGAGSIDTNSGTEWLGRLTSQEMAEVYARAAVYTLPALYEPFGLTILEAALSGCALVLGDIPTLRENWNGAALFVPPRDGKQLVHSINAVCQEESLRRALARRAARRGSGLTSDRMAQSYYQSYCQLSQRVHATAVA